MPNRLPAVYSVYSDAMRVLALVSSKGGTAKTSLATALAVQTGGRLFDLDPQASACRWRDRREAETPIVDDVNPVRLRQILAAAESDGAELVVLDTGPRSETAALEAVRAAHLVVVPCRAQMVDLETVPITKQLLDLAPGTPAVAVLVAVPPRGSRADQARRVLQRLGLPVCPHTIGHRAAWGDASALGLTVVEHDPRGRAAAELRRVAAWVTKHLDQPGLLEGRDTGGEA